jgi:hypothetical protein
MMRKIDYYGQVVFSILMVLTAASYFVYKSGIFFALIGLFILGIWQIISALTVTFSQALKVHNAHIRNYWKVCISILVIFTGMFFAAKFDDKTLTLWLLGISLIGGMSAAFYYLYLYQKYFLQPVIQDTSATVTEDDSLLPFV